MKNKTIRFVTGCLFLFLFSVSAVASESELDTGTQTNGFDVGDPIYAGTGEFHFTTDLMGLGGRLPLDLKLYYGSIPDAKQIPDGLPANFAHNHRAGITRITVLAPEQILLQLGLGVEIGFIRAGSSWEVAGHERLPYRLKETDQYYYFMDPEKERVWTFEKPPIPTEYRVNERVSIGSDGTQGDDNSAKYDRPGISADGRYVVFNSDANNLVSNDTNTKRDIFVRDRQTGSTIRVNMGNAGGTPVQADGNSYKTVIAAGGRYVAFESYATNLVADDTNTDKDIFVHDLQGNFLERVSMADDGSQSDGSSSDPRISADGRYVAFNSSAENLVPGAPGDGVYVRDMQNRTTVCVSVDSNGNFANDSSSGLDLSANGRVVAFCSYATNLVPNDANDEDDIFVHDMDSGETSIISVDSSGTRSNGYSYDPSISGDGRYVVFLSDATNLVDNDYNLSTDVFLHDRQTGQTRRVNVDSNGNEANNSTMDPPSISDNGRYVAFSSRATNLTANDTNGVADIFLHDTQTGKTFMVSRSKFGDLADSRSEDPFVSADGRYVAYGSKAVTLVEDDTNGFKDVFVSGKVEAGNAYLVEIRDRNGNSLIYDNPADGNLALRGPDRVHDGKGRELNFTYGVVGTDDTTPKLTAVTDGNGRSVTFNYEEKPVDNPDGIVLRSITDPMGYTTTYAYAGQQRIESVTRPEGNTPYTQTYGTEGNVTSQTDAYGNTTTITRDPDEDGGETKSLTVTYADAATETYKHAHKGRVAKSITDPEGGVITFQAAPQRDRVTGVTDRLGDSTNVTYHEESGKLLSFTNAEGKTVTYEYTAANHNFTNPLNIETISFTFYEIARVDLRDGNYELFTYDAKGNRLTHIKPDGGVWTYTYNANGQVLTEANPAGGVATYTYNGDSTLASRTDSDIGITTFQYDAYKRLIKTTHPGEIFKENNYDLIDMITSRKDENGNTWAYEYDKNGNLIKVTDPATNNILYTYDLMDRVQQVTNRLGHKTVYTYDNKGKRASVTGPDGIKTSFGYNNKGWRTNISTAGKTWNTSFDLEGIMASQSTPLGYTTNYTTNNVAKITKRTDALGRATNYAYDAAGRLISRTDLLGNKTTYTYNKSGLLNSVNVSGVGTATYTRNNRGLISNITDLNGQEWNFSYSKVGRTISKTDPSGKTVTYSYNSRGRESVTNFADSHNVTRTYDGNGNTTRKQYTDGTDLNYTYDSLNRIMAAGGINLARNAESKVAHTEIGGVGFGASYDTGGRLSQVTYNNGALAVTYAYEAATGLLSSIGDSVTGTQIDFAYDDDNRMTGISRSDGVNVVTTAYTLDQTDQISRIQSGGIIDIKYTRDDADRVTQVEVTAPLDPAQYITQATVGLAYDSASRISSTGYAHDARGRIVASPGMVYTWDDASRMTAMNGTTFTYSDLNDLIARVEGGQTTRFFYNYAISLKPIMAEKDEGSGHFRYYVWTPNGELLYMIDAGDGNKVYYYHFDMTGATLALTDTAGVVTDAYCYDPNGRILEHTGISTQPFTFAGKWGVRQEGNDGNIYHMRARYYDAVIGRFISREPLWPDIAHPLELNPYQYAVNDPVSYIDASGMKKVDLADFISKDYQKDNDKGVGNFFDMMLNASGNRDILINPPIPAIRWVGYRAHYYGTSYSPSSYETVPNIGGDNLTSQHEGFNAFFNRLALKLFFKRKDNLGLLSAEHMRHMTTPELMAALISYLTYMREDDDEAGTPWYGAESSIGAGLLNPDGSIDTFDLHDENEKANYLKKLKDRGYVSPWEK